MENQYSTRPATLWCTCLHCMQVAVRQLQQQGLDIDEIAATLGESRSTVEALLKV
jgi:transcriptional regulator